MFNLLGRLWLGRGPAHPGSPAARPLGIRDAGAAGPGDDTDACRHADITLRRAAGTLHLADGCAPAPRWRFAAGGPNAGGWRSRGALTFTGIPIPWDTDILTKGGTSPMASKQIEKLIHTGAPAHAIQTVKRTGR